MAEQAIGALVAVLFGLGAIGLGASAILPHVQQTQGAEPVEATILSSETYTYTDTEGQSNYGVDIAYRYTVDGQTYTSESVFPGEDHGTSASRAEDLVAEYQPDTTVTAYVDPADPTVAYLVDESPPWYFWALPAIGGLLLLMGGNTLYQLARGRDPTAVQAE